MKAIVIWEKDKVNNFSVSSNSLEGFVLFNQEKEDSHVEVTVYLKGNFSYAHGFHIHEKPMNKNSMESSVEECCEKLGGHFNVGDKWSLEDITGTKHGNHTGDLCFNIYPENGIVDFSFDDHKISLFKKNKACILNRSLVIHEGEDDKGEGVYPEEEDEKNIQTKITGNAGKRIACGNITEILD